MKTEEELTQTQGEIDVKIEAIEAELRAISPEVVSGDGKAKSKALKLQEELSSLRLSKDLQIFAAEESARRAEEARLKADLEARERARKAYAEELETVIGIEKKIASFTDQLEAACREHGEKVARLGGFAIRAAAPTISRNVRDKLNKDRDAFLEAKLTTKGKRNPTPLDQQHASMLEGVKASLATPLEPRKPKEVRHTPEPEPIPTVFFTVPTKKDEIGNSQAATALVFDDGRVEIESTPPYEKTKQARSVYRGGYRNTVKPEDVEPLLAVGLVLQEGFILPGGAYSITGKLRKETADAGNSE